MIRPKPLAICTSLLATAFLTGAVASRAPRAGARPTTSITTDIGTFTQTPQPRDTSITAVLWAISQSGENTVGTTWFRYSNPFSDLADNYGYTTEDLTRVYRTGFPTTARGINDAGDVAGFSFDTTRHDNRAFGWLYHAGAYFTVDVPGSMETRALGINNSGTVIGTYRTLDGETHRFLYTDSTFTSFDLPDSFHSCNARAFAINSSGEIAGAYQRFRAMLPCGGPWHGFLRDADGSTFSSFEATTDAVSTKVNGINDRGDVVGNYDTSDGRTQGFLLPGNGDPPIVFDFPHQTGSTGANGVDQTGKILVGSFGDFSNLAFPGAIHPFKLTLCDPVGC